MLQVTVKKWAVSRDIKDHRLEFPPHADKVIYCSICGNDLSQREASFDGKWQIADNRYASGRTSSHRTSDLQSSVQLLTHTAKRLSVRGSQSCLLRGKPVIYIPDSIFHLSVCGICTGIYSVWRLAAAVLFKKYDGLLKKLVAYMKPSISADETGKPYFNTPLRRLIKSVRLICSTGT
jgi:hypothetical protein